MRSSGSDTVSIKRWPAYLVTALALLLAGGIRLGQIGDGTMTDPFHEGEYFATAATLLDSGGKSVVTIHGALDFLPALLAIEVYGAGHHFLPTRLLYALADFVAAALLCLLTLRLSRRRDSQAVLVPLIAASGAFLVVGHRDLLLLASLVLFQYCQEAEGRTRRWVLEVALGLTMAANLFWSFDRGLAGALALGVGCLTIAIRSRRFIAALLCFGVGVLALGQLSGQFSLGSYFASIALLSATSGQWAYPVGPHVIAYTAVLTVLDLAALASLAWLALIRRRESLGALATPLVLGLLVPFFWKIGTNRADDPHFWMGLWMPALALAYVWAQTRERPIARSLLLWTAGGAVAVFLMSSWLGEATELAPLSIPTLAQLGHPPKNEMLVGDASRWVASELKRAGAPCVFDFANNGLVNGLTGLPACTRFVYPVYATREFEEEIIEALETTRPTAVVFSAGSTGFAIDHKTMHQRLPGVTSHLVKALPFEQCRFDYCLRYASEPAPTAASTR